MPGLLPKPLHGVAHNGDPLVFPMEANAPWGVAGQVNYTELNIVAEIYDIAVRQLAVHCRWAGDRVQELRPPRGEILAEHVLIRMPDEVHVRFEVFDQEGIFSMHVDLCIYLVEQRVVAAHMVLVPVRVKNDVYVVEVKAERL